MRRRAALKIALGGAAWLLCGAHTPYGQWQVYRRRHLLVGTSKADAPTYPLGQRIVEVLASRLPESSARVTRGPSAWRLASLITSGQIELVLLSAADVAALRDGRPPFEAFGATRLCTLFAFGAHWLVCRPDFPDRHAYLVVETLATHGDLTLRRPHARPGAQPGPDPSGRARLSPRRARAGIGRRRGGFTGALSMPPD